ncbi:MAG: hypothetical protein ACYCSO_07660 [Cuniculiplasma sp.]
MVSKSSKILVIVVVVLFVAVGALYATGMLNFNNTGPKTTSPTSPEAKAPNVVSSSVVSKAFGSQWRMDTGAAGTSLNASTFMGGGAFPLLIPGHHNINGFLSSGVSIDPFPNVLGLGNNLTYNSYQIGIYVPPQNGFAIVSFAHSTQNVSPGYIVSFINSQIYPHFKGKAVTPSSDSYKNGTVDGANYDFASIPHFDNRYYLEGVIANYSVYNILLIYLTPHFTGYGNFTEILSSQIGMLKSAPTTTVHSVLFSSSQVKSVTGISFKLQSTISVNFNNTRKLLSEYESFTGASSSISKTNSTLLNNTIGNVQTVSAENLIQSKNTTEGAMIYFSNSSSPASLYDLMTKTSENSSSMHLGIYSGWHYMFQNTTDYSYSYRYNQTTGNGTYTKTPILNTSFIIAVNGNYMFIMEVMLKSKVFDLSMAQSILTDESSLI